MEVVEQGPKYQYTVSPKCPMLERQLSLFNLMTNITNKIFISIGTGIICFHNIDSFKRRVSQMKVSQINIFGFTNRFNIIEFIKGL